MKDLFPALGLYGELLSSGLSLDVLTNMGTLASALRPLRVAFCYYGNEEVSGPGSWLVRMLPRLRHAVGIEPLAIRCMTSPVSFDVDRSLAEQGIEVRTVDFSVASIEVRLSALLAALVSSRVDVVVADHVPAGFLTAYWFRAQRIPTVLVMRSDEPWYWRLAEQFLWGPPACRVGAVVTVSREIHRRCAEKCPPDVPLLYCPSSVPLPDFKASWREGIFHAVYLGRLESRQKRLHEMVLTLVKISQARPWFSATLYGDGPLRSWLVSYLREKTGHRVAYGGVLPRDAVFPTLAKAQALVLFSAYEGLSTALQEAMAVGMPVIVRRMASGQEGVVQHGRNAWLFDDDSEVAEALDQLADDRNLWDRLAGAARQTAERLFAIDVACKKWTELLQGLAQPTARELKVPSNMEVKTQCLEHFRELSMLQYDEANCLASHHDVWGAGLSAFVRSTDNPLEGRIGLLTIAAERGVFTKSDYAALASSSELDADTRCRLTYEAVCRGWLETRSVIQPLSDLSYDWEERRQMLYKSIEHGKVERSQVSKVAQDLLNEASGIHRPDHDLSHRYAIASLLELAGQMAEAKMEFESILKDDAGDEYAVGCCFHLGRICKEIDAREEARMYCLKCLSLCPGHLAARDLLASLRPD
jgi:glycosyltransferase involved in cell wall biosynthesis